MMCSSMEIDGRAFCLGLKSFSLLNAAPSGLRSLPSLINPIERADLRPKYTTNPPERFSLDTGSLAELIDRFHTRKASDVRDKVYALLGMSSDNPNQADLQPDYEASWQTLFLRLIKFVLGHNVSVETSYHNQRAVVRGKGCALGAVSSMRSHDGQVVTLMINGSRSFGGAEMEWTLQASAKSIRKGDVVCFLQGASKPTIIRLCKDYFDVVVISANLLIKGGGTGRQDAFKSLVEFPRDFTLVWDLERLLEESQDREELETLTETDRQEPKRLKPNSANYFDKATRTWNVALVLEDLPYGRLANERFYEAVEGYEKVFGKEHSATPNFIFALTPLSWAAENGYDDIVKLLLTIDGIDPDLKGGQYGRIPLSWAADRGHEAVVELLLEAGQVDVNSRGYCGQNTPLLYTAQGGHEAVVKLLLMRDNIECDSKDKYGWTPLWWTTYNGHIAVVKLLLNTGKVDSNSKDKYCQTPLWWASYNGHTAVVKLLLETDQVKVDLPDENGRTPLWWATCNGHMAVVKLLLKTGMVQVNPKDHHGQTPEAAQKLDEESVELYGEQEG